MDTDARATDFLPTTDTCLNCGAALDPSEPTCPVCDYADIICPLCENILSPDETCGCDDVEPWRERDERDDAYERAAARARNNDFADTGGKDWT